MALHCPPICWTLHKAAPGPARTPTIAKTPTDAEGETEDERRAAAESMAWFERQGDDGVPDKEVLAHLSLTLEDFKNPA